MIENPPSKLKLKIAYWYVTHKILLKRVGISFVILVLLSLVGYSVYGFINHFTTLSEFDETINHLAKNQINFKIFKIKIKPTPLKTESVKVIKSAPDKYDFFVQVKNLDEKWFIRKIKYQFISSNYNSPVYEDFILPNQTKYFFALNQTSKATPSRPNLEILNLEYQRIRSDLDVSQDNLVIENVEFIPAGGDALNLPRINFQISNTSLYNFWEVPLKIILYNHSTPIYINIISLTQFQSEETRLKEFVLFDEIKHNVTNVVVVPDVNLFDDTNFMSAEKEVGELK